MLDHPALIMMPFIFLLIFSKRNGMIFKISGLALPIAGYFVLIAGTGEYSYDLPNFTITWEFSDLNKFIGSAFLLILLMANSYALGQKRFREVIIGSFYGFSLFITLMAKDFISMFIGLELMMVSAGTLIFIGNQQDSSKMAKRYLLTHLVSSNLILIGITHIVFQNGSASILLINNLITNTDYSCYLIYMLLAGLVINIAAFPFSGWMVNYYNSASGPGFLYLISFTTKVSVMLLIKLFTGCEYLKYIALLTIIYAGFKALRENSLTSLLSYLSILSISVMIFGISIDNENVIKGVSYYLFIHIIYKAVLSIFVAVLRDNRGITLASELGKVTNKFLLLPLVISISLMINLPGSMSFYSKNLMASSVASGDMWNLVIVLANFFVILALPWKFYINNEKIKNLRLNMHTKFSFTISLLVLLAFGFTTNFVRTSFGFEEITITGNEILKQLAVFCMAAFLIAKFKYKRKIGKALNLLETAGVVFFYLYNRFWQTAKVKTSEKEQWSLRALEEQILEKLAIFHNQKTAIFMVFAMLVAMYVLVLMTKAIN